MDLTEGSETSAKLNLTPGKYPKENIQVSEHGENLKSVCIVKQHITVKNIQILSAAQQCFYEKFISPATTEGTQVFMHNTRYFFRF
jgi:hypothetical protein